MNWAPIEKVTALLTSLRIAASSEFEIFLLLCFAGALCVAAVVIGGIVTFAIFGDRKAAAKTDSTQRFATKASLPAAARSLLILYASETGNSRGLAIAAGAAAQRLALKVRVVDMAAITVQEAAKATDLLVIASTWGEGEPPQRAVDFYRSLMGADAARFDGVRYAILALGDRAYANFENFCRTGRSIDIRLGELGGQRLAERSECDADFEDQASDWIGTQLARLSSSATAVRIIDPGFDKPGSSSRMHPFDAEITEKDNLNGAKSTTSTYHVTLSPVDFDIPYEPGDSIGLFPENDPNLIAEILSIVGLSENLALRDSMQTHYDITSLTFSQIQAYAAFTTEATIGKIATNQNLAAEYLEGGRQLIDLLAAAPVKLSAEQLTSLFRRLQPRLYSISSSRKATPGKVDLLVAAVAYQAFGRGHKGVASMYVAERCRVGDRLRIYLNPNPNFRLPSDPSRNIIMIGPGTGVAPYRAFMQERSALDATGQNWLFYGSRNRNTDFLYEAEWDALRKQGVLTRMDLAFSRDQAEKIYVQHRMWESRHDLYSWLKNGAAIYVCGARAMARDVDSMLQRIAVDQGGFDEIDAQTWIDDLRRSNRYLRDVY